MSISLEILGSNVIRGDWERVVQWRRKHNHMKFLTTLVRQLEIILGYSNYFFFFSFFFSRSFSLFFSFFFLPYFCCFWNSVQIGRCPLYWCFLAVIIQILELLSARSSLFWYYYVLYVLLVHIALTFSVDSHCWYKWSIQKCWLYPMEISLPRILPRVESSGKTVFLELNSKWEFEHKTQRATFICSKTVTCVGLSLVINEVMDKFTDVSVLLCTKLSIKK